MPRLSVRLLFCAFAMMAIGCSAPAVDDAAMEGDGALAAGGASNDPAYPALYREMRLPVIEGARVMSTGRQETSLRDGLSLRVTTDMGVQQARTYFSQALEGQGWNVTASRQLPGISVANVTATKDEVTYTATFTSSGGSTDININVVQN